MAVLSLVVQSGRLRCPRRTSDPAPVQDLWATADRTRGVKVRLVLALTAVLAVGCGGRQGEEDTGNAHAGPATEVPANEVLSGDPYMGVSCNTPNSFACDRVGLAVWLREPAVSVDATIAGRRLQLDDPSWSGPEDGQRRGFAGFLQPAGLIDGPLQVPADDGPDRWIGRNPVSATVDLRIAAADGTVTTTTVEVGLSPGWG